MIKNKLSKRVDKQQEKIVNESRSYIGASSIGSDCLRQIWYQYKGYTGESIPAKTQRTWAIGKRLEGLVIEWLRDAGIKVDTTPVSYQSNNVDVFQGHFDGILSIGKKKAILEIKTAKDASFTIFVNHGLQIWNKQYYAQVQSYMGMSGIHSAYIFVLNKDNSDVADELIDFDKEFYEKLENKARMIAISQKEPPKVNGSPLWYQCKMCRFNTICHVLG